MSPRRRWLATLAVPLALRAAGVRAAGGGRTLVVGPGERWRTLHDALGAADSGDTVLLQPGTYPGDVAVIEQQRLTVRGLGAGAVLQADGRHAEGKATLVLRGSATLENLEFRGARVPSGNGAGIRFERGHLVVRRCRFFDNENGILTAYGADMTLAVDGCAFGAAPRHEGLLHHLLYVGAIGRLTLTGSRFTQGWRGHLVKSRAHHSLLRGNLLQDAPDGEASYELEFAEGGHHVVVGNVIVQSALTQNPVLVSLGAEARSDGSKAPASLVMAHNTLVNQAGDDARFLRVWTDKLPADTPVQLSNNLFAGPGARQYTAGQDGGGNRHVGLAMLRDVAHGDFRLAAGSPLRGTAVALPAALTPPGAPAGRLSPGALQPAD